MATIFPSNPTVGQIYQSYEWDGEAWVIIGIDFTKTYAVYPLQTGNSGKFLTTDGTDPSWGTVDLTTKANINSPNLTGIPTAPTATANTNTTQLATTAFVTTADNLKANLDSPTFTGTVTSSKINLNGLQTVNTTGNQIQIHAGSSNAPTVIHRADGSNYYLLLSNTGISPSGTWNSLRPFYMDLFTGLVSMENGLNVVGLNATGTPLAPTAVFGTSTNQLATTEFVQGAVDAVSLNTKTSSYTLTASDAGTLVIMNVGSANSLTVPLNSSVPFALGTQVPILQLGTGQTSVVAAGGVTIRFTPGLKLRTQYSAAALIKIDTDVWILSGDIVA